MRTNINNKNGSLNKTVAKQWQSLFNSGGAVMASEWTNGRGRHTTRRPTPPWCAEFVRDSHYDQERWPQAVQNVFDNHPRCISVIGFESEQAAKSAAQMLNSKGE